MAFNLNKNEGSAPRDPAGRPAFDLSKNDAPAVEETSRKRKYWIWALLVILLAGAGAWYYTTSSGARSLPPRDSVLSSAAKPPQEAIAGDTAKAAETAADSSGKALALQAVAAKEEKQTGVSPKDTVTNRADTFPAPSASPVHPVAASFHRGSSAFVNISTAMVAQIIAASKNNGVVNVNGYASSEGDVSVNQQISQKRADVFKQYLVSKGLRQNIIVATGRGITDPIASNDTEAGRRKNRRVEVILQ
jgi:outer membrane protein OmpA-like peptidoglycan-associated protein